MQAIIPCSHWGQQCRMECFKRCLHFHQAPRGWKSQPACLGLLTSIISSSLMFPTLQHCPLLSWTESLLQASRCQSVQYPHLIFSQPSLSLRNYMSPEHCSEHSPSACTVWEFTANSFHTEEAAPCKEADSKAMTTTWNQHGRDLFVIICGYTFMTTHSTSSIHMVLSCSALNSAH